MERITFNYTDGGLGLLADNDDHISMLLFDRAAPTGFDGQLIKSFRARTQAENTGVTGSELYHVQEFFRLSPFGKLYVGYGELTAAEIFKVTGGEVRQLGMFGSVDDLGIAQTLGESLAALGAPCVVVLGINDLEEEFPNLSTVENELVFALVAGDGLLENYIPAVGLALGAVSAANVHECIGWVDKFNLLDRANLAFSKVRLAMGRLSTPADELELQDKRYGFITHYVGDSGAYFSDSLTATAATSDYGTLENNRTVQKAVRGVYTALLPKVNSPLRVNASTGELDAVTAGDFESTAERPLAAMLGNGELSGYSVFVPVEQNVLSTGKIEVILKLAPMGVAREIAVTIGLSVSV